LKSKGIIIFLVLLIIFSFISVNILSAEEIEEPKLLSATSGNDYLKLQEHEKEFYLRGMVDSLCAIFQAYEPETYQKYSKILKGMTGEQLVKIFVKYFDENPEKLHWPAAVCFLYALDEIAY
jgi:hypothetical protein